MKKQFLKHYDETVEEVFSYFYERTYDRGKSLELVRNHFSQTWDSLSRSKAHTLRSDSVSESPSIGIAPKASDTEKGMKINVNQFGY